MTEQVEQSRSPAAPRPQAQGRAGPSLWQRIVEGADRSDLDYGQSVIVTARWILVGAGLALALWNPASIGPLRLQVLVLLLIAVANFFLHAQLLRKRGAVEEVAYVASAADLAVITLLVASQGGYDSNLFVFYFPAVLAFSVAFQPQLTATFVGATLGFYTLICFQSLGTDLTTDHAQNVVVRLLMITAVAVCGALYQRVERNRRAGESGPPELLDEPELRVTEQGAV